MKRIIACFCFIAVISIVLSSCVSTQQNTSASLETLLSKENLDLISEAVCEIVVQKNEKDSASYEKDPKQYMDLLPLWFRNDEYFAIGTAFAVSETKMLTAMHVMSLGELSLIYDKFFIRDSNGSVYEIGNLTKLELLKDVVQFEAPGKTFTKWFTLQDKIELNTPVISVGSIIGEGIIKRSGLLTSKKRNEVDKITWDTLSFSADSSPGNSGGPLLNKACEVIGIILSRNEDQKLGFALPAYEINRLKDNYAVYYLKTTYGFDLIQDTIIENFSYNTDLPKVYTDYRKSVIERYSVFYEQSMKKLITQNEKKIFPQGKTSRELLQYCPRSSFPEIFNEDKDDRNWVVSSTKFKTENLDNNGYVRLGQNGPFVFLTLRKPDDISLIKLYKDPKLYMDLILQVINESRAISSQKIRITSYGKPFLSYTHTDKYKRKWMVNYWHVEFTDTIIMMFSLPTPMGIVSILKTTGSTNYKYYEFDYKLILDYVSLAYYGTFDAWNEFLGLKEYLPEAFENLSVTFEKNTSARINCDIADVTFDNTLFDITGKSDLLIGMSVFMDGDKPLYAPRRIIIGENENKESFFSIYKALSYVSGLPDTYKDNWKSTVKKDHPLDGKPFYDNNLTRISSLAKDFRDKTEDELMAQNFLYTLYIGIEKKLDDSEMIKKLDTLDGSIVLKYK